MDQIIGLLNEMGKSNRQRSLSDGDHENGKFSKLFQSKSV